MQLYLNLGILKFWGYKFLVYKRTVFQWAKDYLSSRDMLDIRNSSGMRVVKILVIFWFSSPNNVGSATAQVHAAAESEEEPGQWKVQGEQEAAPNLPAKLGDQILLVDVTTAHDEDFFL